MQADFSLGLATIDERRKISNLLIYSYKYDFYIFIWNRNWTLNIQNWTLENLKVTTLGSIESIYENINANGVNIGVNGINYGVNIGNKEEMIN